VSLSLSLFSAPALCSLRRPAAARLARWPLLPAPGTCH